MVAGRMSQCAVKRALLQSAGLTDYPRELWPDAHLDAARWEFILLLSREARGGENGFDRVDLVV